MMICNPRTRVWLRIACIAVVALTLFDTTACAQQTPADPLGWDAPRALELVERARARRQLPAQDTTLRNYTAKAEGFIFFYLDRRDTGERTLVKTDQVALEVFWAAPNISKQRFIGMRDESRLPNPQKYHLDHLTVVQNSFGDLIRMGDGDEVKDIPHPAAPGSDSIYQFRFADSLSITLPSAAQPILVYEIQVRPRRNDRPALVGSMYVERRHADIVRMTFTFTPVSYVDRRLDYISVSLDNGLWEGRYWLPNEQTLQIRRQIPELDFAAGSVIQGRMRITDYSFNDSLPPATFMGNPVTAAPHADLERHVFERDLHAELNEFGLEPPPDLTGVRRVAAELLGTSRLSGLPPLRLALGSVSQALRYDRAQGVVLGAGVLYAPGPLSHVNIAGGYAFGADQPWTAITAQREVGKGAVTARLLYADVRDIGVRPGVPPLINTLAAAVLGRDYLDPYYADGVQLSVRQRLNSDWWWAAGAGGERHRSAELTQQTALFDDSATFRPVRAILPGNLGYLRFTLDRPVIDARANAWGATTDIEIGTYDGAAINGRFVRATFDATMRRSTASHHRQLLLTLGAGALVPDEYSVHQLFHIGGINTLPGYDYRRFNGLLYALLNAEARQAVWEPWIGVRGIAALGAAGGHIEDTYGAPPVPGQKGGSGASLGAGVSLLWDIIHLDLVRGLSNSGKWQLNLSFHRDFWDIS